MATHTRTVVFTDLANYTASVGRSDREGLRNLIAAHEKLVSPALQRHGGRVVKNLGDSFMAIFDSCTDAVRSGMHLVESITATGSAGFSIRASMATGDVEEIDGDAFGEAVNLAARILSKTPSGEVWFSHATLLCMNQAEIPWESVGRYRLKGISGEQPVFRAVPGHRCWLPEPIKEAIKAERLVQIRRGEPLPGLPPRALIMLVGFPPGSQALRQTIDSLPIVDPAALWLIAYNIAPSDRNEWAGAGRGLIVGQPESVERAIEEQRRAISRTTGSDTIIIDLTASAVVELVMSGLALPAVPMSEVVAGYTYDLLADGRWVNKSDHAVARVDIAPGRVSLTALVPGIQIGGRQAPPGQGVELKDADEIRTPSGITTFVRLDDNSYAGLLVADTMARLGIAPGQQAEIGREPNHPGLALPDRRGQDNIRWCVGSRAARARESGFTLDRALAGRRQAAVCLGPSGATVLGLHDRCPTYVVNANSLEQVREPRPVTPGDLVVTGTSVIAVRDPLI